mmetsp:Transcript_34975/g.46017  ORF Transcript_34975/g.46017 Transcript_34975/m.46017 type:complete len:84 (+) Transcript_34975:58-309(+)
MQSWHALKQGRKYIDGRCSHSFELVVSVQLLVLVVLELDEGAEAGQHQDEDEIEVEPGSEGILDALLNLLSQVELVGEAACVE